MHESANIVKVYYMYGYFEPPGRPIRLLVCSVNFSETLFTLSYTLLYLNTTKCCDLLAGSRRNFFSGVWRKVCGRRVTKGWSDHAVNGDSISQGALKGQLKKPLAA